MLTVDQSFKDAMNAPVKRVSGYLVLQDGTELKNNGDLKSFTIQSTGEFLKTAMSKFTATLLGEHPIVNTMLDAYYGTFYDDEWHYILKGKFQITEAVFKKDTNTTELTGYDNMLQFVIPYVSVGDYPTTLYNYLRAVCSGAGVPLQNDSIYNGNLVMEEDYYKNVEAFTFRDVLEDICEASASYGFINPSGNLELRQISDTGEVLTYDNLLKYSTGDEWGGINSLVLSRQPQNDDVYVQDEGDINAPTTRNILDLTKFNVGYSTGEA